MTETFGQPLGPGQVPEKVMEPKPTNSSEEDLWSSLGTKDSLAAALTKQGLYDEAETLPKRGFGDTRDTRPEQSGPGYAEDHE